MGGLKGVKGHGGRQMCPYSIRDFPKSAYLDAMALCILD